MKRHQIIAAAAIAAGFPQPPQPRVRSHFIMVKLDAEAVWIVDQCSERGGLSVTNDAEAVTAYCAHHHGKDKRIFYRDTQGNWDELVHEAGVFKDFRPARDRAIQV